MLNGEIMGEDSVETIDEYISNFPENIQKILEKIRKTIKEVAPEATEKNKLGNTYFLLKQKFSSFCSL